jgi:hypothetical protein
MNEYDNRPRAGLGSSSPAAAATRSLPFAFSPTLLHTEPTRAGPGTGTGMRTGTGTGTGTGTVSARR